MRQIISLIKSHGVGICVVDQFFTQPSIEYSPPIQDPQLHIDGIISYGVKIGEKDPTAVPQLFHYLYNNFKIALASSRLKDEQRILERAMTNPDVMSFVLQFMLPAITDATARLSGAWLLLDVYVGAVQSLLTRSCIPMQLRGEDIAHSASLLGAILAWFGTLREKGTCPITAEQLHVIARLMMLANAQQCSLRTWLHLPQQFADVSIASTGEVEGIVQSLATLASDAESYLLNLLPPRRSAEGRNAQGQSQRESRQIDIQLHSFLGGLSRATPPDLSGDPRVTSFTNHIVADVRKSWVILPGLTTVRMAGKSAIGIVSSTPTATGSQSCNGTSHGPWNVSDLAETV